MNLLQYSKTLNYKENKILVNYCIRLHKFMQGCEIEIEFIDDLRNNYYLIGQKAIQIDSSQNTWTILSAIFHEIGHCLDECENEDLFFYQPNILKSKKEYTAEEIELEVGSEKRAWKKAEGVAKLLKIPLEAWYWSYKDKNIKSYETWAKRKMKKLAK